MLLYFREIQKLLCSYRLNCFEFPRISLKLVGTDDEAKVFCFGEQVLKLDGIDFDS